jgi:membrane-associated protease RseP (regulator of RpoE activity)
MRWNVVVAAIGMVAASGATALAMSPQSGSAKGDPPVVRLPQTGPFEIYRDRVRLPGAPLGVTMREVDAAAATANRLSAQEGAVVVSVVPGSAADKGGLRAGDVIVEYDKERVRSASQLARMVRETPAGRFVRVGAVRDGKRIELAVAPDAGSRRSFPLFGDALPGEPGPSFPRDYLFRFRGPEV